MARKYCPVYLWVCSSCGNKFYGKNPPSECEKCFSETNRFILLPKEANVAHSLEEFNIGLPSLNTPLYLVGSIFEDKINAMCCSSVTQITHAPMRLAVSVNKNNLTHDYIKVGGVFSLSILGSGQKELAHFFGKNTGRKMNKFERFGQKPGRTGSPLVDGCLGYYECEVDHGTTMDLDTHTLFVGKVIDAIVMKKELPLTYHEYFGKLSKN